MYPIVRIIIKKKLINKVNKKPSLRIRETVNTKNIVTTMSLIEAKIGYTRISGSKPLLNVSIAIIEVTGMDTEIARIQAIVGTKRKIKNIFSSVLPINILKIKETNPRIMASIIVITKTDLIRVQYSFVLLVI
jgi:hypothetical protein